MTGSSSYLWRRQCRRSYATPAMWRSLGQGQEVPMEETELYQYRRYRWLTDEAEELKARYREFRLLALLEAATKVTGNDAVNLILSTGVRILKCVEGQYNKAFVLTMNNGQEIIAKLPNPNAGPSFYTTASEVATRQFLGIPVPRIYAWSADESNAVGAKYILEEKAMGQPLGSLWGQLSFSVRSSIVEQVLDIEKKLTSVNLPQHGCIYYQSDLESRPGKPIFSPIHNQSNDLPNFAIGPLTHPKYWRGQRATMTLDRENNVADHAIAIGTNEIQWAKMHAQPRMNYQRSQDEPETPDNYISLLERYITLVPSLISSGTEYHNKLLHPDLHLDNIFIDPQTNNITAVIDWQHMSTSPVCLLPVFPQMLEPLWEMLDNQLPHFYLSKLKYIDPLRCEILTEPRRSIRVEPILVVPCCWDGKDLVSLRNSMINVIAQWPKIRNTDIECPINFTKELEQHRSEIKLVEGNSIILHQLQDEGLISLGGIVPRDQYEIAREWNNYYKGEFIGLAEDEEQKKLHAKLWPYS
ncbi:kinase-like domain-containing protein [Aspergillus californicus]